MFFLQQLDHRGSLSFFPDRGEKEQMIDTRTAFTRLIFIMISLKYYPTIFLHENW